LFAELPLPTLIQVLEENAFDVFGSAVAYSLFISPVTPTEFKNAFVGSANYYMHRVQNANHSYTHFLVPEKPTKKKLTLQLDREKLEPYLYIYLAWFFRLVYFKRSMRSDLPFLLPYAILSSWSLIGYSISSSIDKTKKEKGRQLIDPQIEGSKAEKRVMLQAMNVGRDLQLITFAYIFPFTFFASILAMAKKKNTFLQFSLVL